MNITKPRSPRGATHLSSAEAAIAIKLSGIEIPSRSQTNSTSSYENRVRNAVHSSPPSVEFNEEALELEPSTEARICHPSLDHASSE